MSEIDHDKRAADVVQSLIDLDDVGDMLVVLSLAVETIVCLSASDKQDAMATARVFGTALRHCVRDRHDRINADAVEVLRQGGLVQ